MTDAWLAAATFAGLCLSAWIGHRLLRVLPDHHRSAQTMGFVQLVSGLLVTFTALVLGLLITTVNAEFRKADVDLRGYAAGIIRLDGELEALGPATAPVRAQLRAYTAAVVASTWPDEPRPDGAYPQAESHGPDVDAPNLAALLAGAEAGIRQLAAASPQQAALQAACLARIDALRDLRWTLVNEAHSGISPPFLGVMLLWLAIVFVSFGLNAPANATATVFIGLVGLSIAGAIFVILELDGPLDGVVRVPSEAMRHALEHLDGLPRR